MRDTNLEREAATVVHDAKLAPGEQNHLRLWCDSNSPFSCKLRTYLNFKGIPYKRQRININAFFNDIPNWVGMSVMPVLLKADGSVLQDTTPIMELLETEHTENSCVPNNDSLAFLMWLLEDFGDEYLTRFSMHYRWGNPQNRTTLSHRLARAMSYGMESLHATEVAPMIEDRQVGFDIPLGLTSEESRTSLDHQLVVFLSILDRHFADYQFLLGDRPSLADFAFYGHLQAHLYQDPVSAELMETHGSRVCNWLETISEFGDLRGQAGQTEFGDWLDLGQDLPSTLQELLQFLARTYLPYSLGVALATAAGDKQFQATVDGVDIAFKTFQYRAWSFENVQKKYLALTDASGTLEDILTQADIQPALMSNGILHCPMFDDFSPPVVMNGVADARIRYLKQKQNQQEQDNGQ